MRLDRTLNPSLDNDVSSLLRAEAYAITPTPGSRALVSHWRLDGGQVMALNLTAVYGWVVAEGGLGWRWETVLAFPAARIKFQSEGRE